MQQVTPRKVFGINLRARLPIVARVLAIAVIIAGIVGFVVSFRSSNTDTPFVMFSGRPELSKEVLSIVEGYERSVTENGKVRLILRAARDVTYTDGHHELEGVHLESYPAGEGDAPDKIEARRAIYDNEKGEVSFAGDVRVETRDRLRVATEAAVYNQFTETARTSAPVNFERENVRGRANSATLFAKQKKLELRGDVAITVEPQALTGNISTNSSRSRPVTIRANAADFEQSNLSLAFSGAASAEQEQELMSGDVMRTKLDANKHVRHIEVRENSYLRSLAQGRAAEVSASDMDFYFTPEQRFERAVAVKNEARAVNAKSLDSDAEMILRNAARIEIKFDTQSERSLLREMNAGGRPTITLAAPRSSAGDARAANKQLTGDDVQLFWRTTGRDLERAEVTGNAEMIVEPVVVSPTAERKKLNAPKFVADFYESGNLAKNIVASGGAKAMIEPLADSPELLPRTLTAANMTANFIRGAQDVERVEASGDAKFVEGDRNAQAANISYTASERVIRLRGDEPVVWDSRARIKATEIESDLARRISNASGRVQTTYYSQEQTGGAAPFARIESPVFVTANAAEFQHETGVGLYTGNARLWQDDNFIKAERITLRRDQRRMEADGSVESALYGVRQREAGNIPVFAIARKMSYQDTDRLLHYEGAVDIRQGTDRITSDVANVYLRDKTYEVERTVAERNVVLTQPGRRGTGERAQFTAADETVMMTGNPARVEDAEQGTTESRRLTVFLREKRVVGDDPGGERATGRVRSTHRVRKP